MFNHMCVFACETEVTDYLFAFLSDKVVLLNYLISQSYLWYTC